MNICGLTFNFQGPFEAIKKVFATGEEYSRMSFLDKSDLFFVDYGIMPLFVYENYIQVDMSSKWYCPLFHYLLNLIVL